MRLPLMSQLTSLLGNHVHTPWNFMYFSKMKKDLTEEDLRERACTLLLEPTGFPVHIREPWKVFEGSIVHSISYLLYGKLKHSMIQYLGNFVVYHDYGTISIFCFSLWYLHFLTYACLCVNFI